MASSKHSSIIAGPSREQLFDALRLHAEGRKTSFTLIIGEHGSWPWSASILSIEAEGVTGDDWIIEASISLDSKTQLVSGRYSTSTRKGYFNEGYMRDDE